jgi:hypothetical protein
VKLRSARTWILIGATGLVLLGGTVAAPAAAGSTPNACIELNGGDLNACNVGHGGRGDLPYAPVPSGDGRSDCIRANNGDVLACSVTVATTAA